MMRAASVRSRSNQDERFSGSGESNRPGAENALGPAWYALMADGDHDDGLIVIPSPG